MNCKICMTCLDSNQPKGHHSLELSWLTSIGKLSGGPNLNIVEIIKISEF